MSFGGEKIGSRRGKARNEKMHCLVCWKHWTVEKMGNILCKSQVSSLIWEIRKEMRSLIWEIKKEIYDNSNEGNRGWFKGYYNLFTCKVFFISQPIENRNSNEKSAF